MNANFAEKMSPNSFRRILAAHGRSSTTGLFDQSSPFDVKQVVQDYKKSVVAKQQTGDGVAPASKDEQKQEVKESPSNESVVGSDSKQSQQTGVSSTYSRPPPEWAKRDCVNNPPLSKTRGNNQQATESLSFYKRPFRVHGNHAWECAMRDLGSVDTLFNRYGFVDKYWRRDIPLDDRSNFTVDK